MYLDNEEIEESSLEDAEEMCSNSDGYHLLSINSCEEQRLLQAMFLDRSIRNHRSTHYILISLKKHVRIPIIDVHMMPTSFIRRAY